MQITDLATIDQVELERRVDALGRLPRSARNGAVVLLRDPQLGARSLLAMARRLRERTAHLGAALWVNDRLDVARLAGADGVHLGRRSVGVREARSLLGEGVVVSVACHAVDEVTAARDAGADACTLSPIFASPGKGAPLGLEALRQVRARLGPSPGFALIALGGVDDASARTCLAAGADGVAAIRADLLSLLPSLG